MIRNRYIAIMSALLAVSFTACEVETDEEPGGTVMQEMAGKWTVTFEQSVKEYNVIIGESTEKPNLASMTSEQLAAEEWEDFFGVGKVSVVTANTADEKSDVMWFSDEGAFWEYKVLCDVDKNTLSFSCTEQLAYEGEDGDPDCYVNCYHGKILKGAATTPRGVPADSIVAYFSFSDDSNGFTLMKMSGYRYTGYPEDR